MIKSFINQTKNSLFKIFIEIFIPNKRIRRIVKGDYAKKYLKKYVKIVQKTSITQSELQPAPDVIWQYWEQGGENVPPLVKTCLKSVKKYSDNRERIIITPQNIENYTDIPGFIYDLKNKGIIKTAHFSDILRSNLLSKHGGTWVDATVLFTDKIPDYITNSDLFVFQNDPKADLDGLNMASYFIHSKPNHKIINDTLNVLYEYWRDNRFLVNYFTFLHAFTMVTSASEENKKLWQNVPFFSFIPVQQMQNELLNKYNPKRFEQLKQTSSIHKLTHKMKVLSKEKNIDLTGTLYEKLIGDGYEK